MPHCRAEIAALGAGAAGVGLPDAGSPEAAGITLRLMPAGRLLSGLSGGDTVLATYDTNAVRENASDLWDHIAGHLFAEFPTARGGRPIDASFTPRRPSA